VTAHEAKNLAGPEAEGFFARLPAPGSALPEQI